MHEVWAVDAKERMQLQDGSWASWLTITDESSGAILYCVAFAEQYWGQVEPNMVREHLQAAFEQWGQPQCLRFDNGAPWGTSSAIPSAMGLWLVGTGIALFFGRPARKTDNAMVERSHGVLAAWVEPHLCRDFEHLQAQINYFTHFQTHRYPVTRSQQTRAEAYPELFCNPRSYNAQYDQQDWQLQAVYDYLAQFRFQRKVAINGRVSLFSREYSLGRDFKRRMVAIQMDAQKRCWIAYDDYGQVLQCFTPKDLSYPILFNMTLAHRRKHKEV